MTRYRRYPYQDVFDERLHMASPPAALPFVQQLRYYLSSDALADRGTGYAAIIHPNKTVCWLSARDDRMMTTEPSPIAIAELQRLLSEPTPDLALAMVNREMFEKRATTGSLLPMRPTLWDIGLHAGHGDTPLQPLMGDTQLQLHRWPDFRILAHRHDHFRLCALMVRHGVSVEGCSSLLDIPRQQVQAFFNAAYLSGYGFPVMGSPPMARRSAADGLANLWRQIRIRWSA
ncbi:hypothetical protein [Stenotrophomonas sp. 24(2023)]|uniref:hypothetical protein n=1 Tax=Stenotrophomonas sp. 24(2023) TaxID=3068324 RepID=UPI0027DF6335|nr:hypothetical protein [Stenotrophomonas sp. 24(2023)]WMJ69893.1 hypothetical protein Q9R17_01945 [Stenotrophomonas sp. 24(2023)]